MVRPAINFGKSPKFSKVCTMNYLAHAHLSFDHPEILVGNMISDFVKGKNQFNYPAAVQKGIRLHRAIDTYTDAHPVTRELKYFFRPAYRLYAGAFGDVVYDHFLANDPAQFANEGALLDFAAATYQTLEGGFSLLSPLFQKMLPYMKAQDWLYNYRYKHGIEQSFGGLVRRAAYLSESETAFSVFNEHYEAMRTCYQEFYPGLKNFAAHQLQELLNT